MSLERSEEILDRCVSIITRQAKDFVAGLTPVERQHLAEQACFHLVFETYQQVEQATLSELKDYLQGEIDAGFNAPIDPRQALEALLLCTLAFATGRELAGVVMIRITPPPRDTLPKPSLN